MIQLKKIEIYLVEEDIQYILLRIALDKKALKRHKFKIHLSMHLQLRRG
jgi:hypothetical protein